MDLFSMTGYGRRTLLDDGREVTVEIKTVNHRFLDIAFRIPRNLSFLEDPIRKKISTVLSRGHVDVFVMYRNFREDAKQAFVDKALIKAYQVALEEASESLLLPNTFSLKDYASLPDVLTVIEKEEDREAVMTVALSVLQLTLDDLLSMRSIEGKALKMDIWTHLSSLEDVKGKIAQRAPEIPRNYRHKIEQRLIEAELVGIDPQRIAQEVALYADKCSIDEELSRLDSHITQITQLLETSGDKGRKLDFLVQELNREMNTIGSKASDSQITNWVVEGKSEIEKLREQVQNVE